MDFHVLENYEEDGDFIVHLAKVDILLAFSELIQMISSNPIQPRKAKKNRHYQNLI